MNYFKKEPPKIIAEIGCNHKGQMNIAMEMIRLAKVFCNVDFIKFQKRNPKELLTEEQYNTPHPVSYHAYGVTYGKHREYLEFTIEQHAELKKYCDEMDIRYSCSVWDLTSLKQTIDLKPAYIKIPSALNTHFDLIEYACRYYKGDIHISLGMTTRKEETDIIDLISRNYALDRIVLYHCTSGYPVPPEDICLLEIKELEAKYGDRVKGIGFSAHYTGIGLDGPAYILGASYIERHFTLDRAWKGTDHAASLEPDGLRRVKKDTFNIFKALTYKKTEILEIEKPQREKLKYRKNNRSLLATAP